MLALQCLGPNLDLLCILQPNTATFCENYAKLSFDAKHLEIECGDIFGAPSNFWPISVAALIS